MAADVYNDSRSWQEGYHLHQLQGNKEYGSEKKGYLLKKSHGIWKVWQRRKCAVQNGTLTISHARSNRQPAELNLLNCQVKRNAKSKKSFDVTSHNRTYHFKAKDEQDCIVWVSVLTNSREEALTVFVRGEQSTGEESSDSLTNAITEHVRRLPGNDVCCDCGSSEPTWLSTNLGILICIECSGIHREMGVHISRIQSLELDKLGTSELLLAKNVGNNRFNDIMEANLPSSSLKPNPSSDVTVRKEYIMAKYIDRRFSRKTCSSSSAKLSDLLEAIRSRDFLALIQAYAEGVELMEPLLEPGQELGETALHHAVRTADRTSLHLVDFLVQNSGNLNKQTALGNTVLHYCSMYGKPQCLKLLLRRKPMVDVVNQAGETALDIAKRLKATQCEDLLSQAKAGKFNPHVHVEYEWNLQQENMDGSNKELDNKQSPVKKEHSPRPQSCGPSSSTSPQDKLSLLGFCTPWEKQQLSDGTFTSQISASTSADFPTSPTSDAPLQRNLRDSVGPEFVKLTIGSFISLDLPRSTLRKKGKNEESRRKLNIMLLSGQRLELTCDTKTICKDVFDTVVAHIGLLEHHLFALATLRDNEYFFVDPDLKLTKVAPEGWKEEPKNKNIATVNFTLFFRIQFFMDDVSLIQCSLTCHQYYLQLRKDVLEERMHCDNDTSLLLASLALQAEYGDYQPEVHGVSYFRLEHYLPPRVMAKLDLSYIREALPRLHNTYVGDSKKQTEFEFVKVCQSVTEYGVHLHQVCTEKKSQPGIVLGVSSKGVLVFELHGGVRTVVHRSPWKDTKQISFSKKKFTLQNTSDGIKHTFQLDNSKVCQYLRQLCSSQLEFERQMGARPKNRDAQETVPSTPVHVASGMKNDMQKPSYVQDSAIDSSEDHRWPAGTPSHSSESSLGLSRGLQEGSLSTQDCRAESASWSQRQVSGFFASHVGDRTWQESQHDSPSSPCAISKASEEKRASDSNESKATKPGISDATDSSDRGDSDMDEATSSGRQDHQTPEKESSSSVNTSNKMNFKTFPSSPPKPGDTFEVELAKDDDSVGISVMDSVGPEFVKLTIGSFISLDLPRSTLRKKGKNEESRRKLNIMLLSGQRLELTCDTKTICKDVFDTVVAHIGLLEHHLFALATLRDNEYFFVDPDLKLTKVAPEGWKEEPKNKNIATVNFTLFFRIQFFMDDVSLIQCSLTCHQYYLQLRKDVLEERMHCDNDTSLLLASLALQAEYGDYQPEVHGVSYFRLEHYLPPRVMAKLDLSYIREALPRLHNTYVGDSKKQTEFEFVKVCQSVTEYGVHLHQVCTEKKSQPGIVLGVSSKGVLVFELHGGVRTVVHRSPWKDTKQISFSKKKFTLQNTSDGIKHTFQLDNSKVCQYLRQLCSSQLEFERQMGARPKNRDAQETVPSTPVHVASGMKNDMQKPSYVQDSAIDSSEDHRWPAGTPSHSSESSLGLSRGLQEGSLSTQDCRAESASWSQRQVSGFFASHVGDRTWQESQHDSPSSPCAISKASEEKRASDSNESKATKPGISDATDSSDRGDSDMDEATSSGRQDHQTPEKESSSSVNTSNKMNFKTFPSSPPKPGDTFEVELAKDDDSVGISVMHSVGPEFVKMMIEPFISLDLPRSALRKKGKNEESRRKLNIMLLSGQRLELTCDTKTICKDVFDTVVAHIGLLEHHLFALATLRDNEYFFVDPDLKLTKVAPEGWKEEPKNKNIATVNFTLFFRIQFFMDDVSLIQCSLTCHQYYLQLRKDVLEERMHCDNDTSLLLASLALQAEYGDYQPEVHGVSYFRLEHYLPPRVMAKLDLSYIREALPRLHNTYVGDSKKQTEFEFVKVCQSVTEYGVHLHQVCTEKKSQPGIVLGVSSKGVLVFELHGGVRTVVHRSPWKDTKQISFSKKKFTLQNTSDGIKRAFQMDNSKVCQYLLHLCFSQLEFEPQMGARPRNRDAQETVPCTPVHVASGMKNDTQKPSYVQDSAIDSSEDHRWPAGTPSHSSESSLGLSGSLREGSLSSQDSRSESVSWSQRQVSGFFASHVGDRTWQESQHDSPSSPCAITKASEEKRASDSNQSKATKPGISDATDSSDRGDSDMDEATSSGCQDHQTPEKESSSSVNTSNKMNFKTFPSSPPKPGDTFEVELAKDDDSVGKSVTHSVGPEFVKMMIEPFISLDLPRSALRKKGKNEESRRKLNIMLLSGQRLELTCDTKTICKDVFDTVVAHIGLLEHHLFALATLRDNEYFFVDPDLKLTKVAPEGWKEEPKNKNIATVNFTLFFRIQFFMDDVSLIQCSLTCHQYYLQLRKDVLEERMHCDNDTSLLLASLALQAEYGDYQPEVHGVSYFRLEHYLPPRVMAKLDLSYIREALPRLHNTYVGDSKKQTEFEFVKVCQSVTEYGVHLHQVCTEKKSQPGIVLGVSSKGVLVFELHGGVRTVVHRSPWKDTKQISFSKKKFTLQNTSDGIKRAFQMDNSKVCQYLLHLCFSQLEFEPQMGARPRNRDAQETVPCTPVHVARGVKEDTQKPSYVQDSAIDSSEDHRWPAGTPSHSSESSLGLSGSLREGSLSSQDSRSESVSWSQRQVSGFFASHVGDRTWQESQHDSPSSPCAITKASEEKRASDSNQSKATKPGISDATDSSDRGDSDMDEATSSGRQDHQTPEKESSSSVNTSNKMNFKTFPSSPPKPGDTFEVELAKDDDSVGKSVTHSVGPEFVKMMIEPFISLDLPRSALRKKGKNEESRRKLNIMLLSGQRLELTCDTKTICKDVFDTVVAHIGLLEHHLFALATLRDNEYFFVDPDLKLTKVAPEGWKEEPKNKNIATVNFTLFFRIQFFMDDVSLIQCSLTCHQYYLQLRKDVLEERMHCDNDTSLLLASLALQAEYGDYQPEVHGVSYFRLEHYLPPRVMAKLDLSYIREALPRLHNTYVGDSKKQTEFEFVKVCQSVTEYGVHLHQVCTEKKSQPGIVLGVSSKGVLVFELHGGVRTVVHRSPWKDTKQISFSKKKFTLQNTSDGIKRAFQMDNSKVCQYLLHLCFSQLEFEPQMGARPRNRDAQETVPCTPVHVASGVKEDTQKPSYVQDSAIDSSEDHHWPAGTPSHSSESSLGLSGSLREGSLSSQDSRSESVSWSQRQVSGFFASHVGDRTWQESQHDSPSSPCAITKASEEKRASDSNQSKATKPGISDATDSSDRGDSDMDEATSSGRQDHQTPEKESSSSVNTSNKMNFKTFPSSPPKPGDTFEVELAKDDDSVGKSVTHSVGPEFVKMMIEPFISLDLPRSALRKKGKNEESRRKLNIMLLSGQRLELTCDTKTICKDVFDTVVAHIGLLEHHLFALATLRDNEYFFVDPDLKLTKVAPEGWKEEPKNKNIATVNFTLFFRIQFFMDDVSLIQCSLTCHQYYLQLRKDVLEERMHCDNDTSLLLASLALQAEYGDYQPEVHGVSYFRLEHYLPPRVMAKLDLSYIRETLPRLHNTYVGDSKKQTEFEFVKVCQSVTEYGVHLHQVCTEKKSQPGIVLGVSSKGVLVFELHGGVRTVVHRSPWKDTKQISFSKKKFTLQNTSDGIKRAFQMDNSKVCQYLLHLCFSQLEFKPQMGARPRNRDAQETGDCVLAVNGVSLEGATHKQAVETLRNTEQLAHLLLEKGQSPASHGPVPITPQCTLPDPDAQGQGPEKMMKKMTSVKDYSFVTEENTFEVKLFKNSSGLGFSFSREENLMNASIVRVQKLFPGHPAAESGKIDVGDVILKVNGASLKGLSQLEVISSLRRTSPEVSLLLCRPPPGVLPEMDPALLTPLHSPAQELPKSSKDTSQPACVEPGTSSDENEMSDKSKKPCTSPSWRDSWRDSSGSGEEDVVKAPAKIPKSDVQEDDFHDDPQEAEFIQSLLDVVDEESQNLLIQNNVARDASVPGALITNARISEERAEDTDCDGSPLPEDFTESTKMNGYEEYCEEKVKSESLIQKS